MKRTLQRKGILLGIVLLLMAILSTALVFSVKASQEKITDQSEAP